MNKPKLTVVLGPTAVGKTDYAIRLAQQSKGAVVSADSRQVYIGMDIGSAKPREAWLTAAHSLDSPEIVSGIPHYLFNIREPNEPLSLAEWQELAFAAIDRILAQGFSPLLVGGTMLYVDSVVYNFEIPAVPPHPALRAELEKRKDLYEELLERDPEAKKFIEPENKRRIIRALEVMEATGRPFSEARQRRTPRYDAKILGLFLRQIGGQAGWDELKRRIELRAKRMFEEGLLEEMAALRQKYGKDLPLLKTMHYRQAGAVLDGAMSQEEALRSMVRDNLRYAHRQMSWWKNRKDIAWV